MKKKMRKKIAVLLACIICTAVTACGGGEPVQEEKNEVTSGNGQVYTYEEEASFNGTSFTVPWKLTLKEDGTYSMVTEGPMGKDTYTGEYTKDGNKVTTGTPNEDKIMIMAGWFNNDYSCDWLIDEEKGTCEPAKLADGEKAEDAASISGIQGMVEDPFFYDGESFIDIQYAEVSESDTMDIYLPKTDEITPVVVMIHGGAFQFGDKQMEAVTKCFQVLLDNNYAVATINYRLSKEAVYPGAVADTKAAIRYLKANAKKYRIDADNVYVWGESAGAYLANMAAETSEIEVLNGDVKDNLEQSSSVKAVISFFAPVDWYNMDKDFQELGITESDRPMGLTSTDNSAESLFLGQNVSEDEKKTSEANPIQYIEGMAQEKFYAFIEHGDADTSVPYVQSQRLYEKLAEKYGEDHVSLTILEGAAHEDDAFYTEENLNKIIEFLNSIPR
ncbi:MAG: alpha/beta hydrolase fold domain-containing protein [Lachnospiraceae bacterium]